MSAPEPSFPPAEKPQLTTDAAELRWSRQFTLRGLLIAVALAAVASALCAAKGIGSLVLFIGLVATWFSWRGYLSRLQTSSARPKMFLSAWLLVGMSLFMPAFGGCQTEVKGWECAYFCAGIEYELIRDSVVESDQSRLLTTEALTFTLLNLANLMFVLSPLMLYRIWRGKGQFLTTLLAISLPMVWLVPIDAPMQYRIGYYVCCAGLTQIHLSYRTRTMALGAMWLMTLILSFTVDMS